MTSPSALFNNTTATDSLTPPANTQLSPSSSNSNDTLNANSFITLLTAQLQAQDPFNPIDPSEMVDQLTQINSLQQLIQIQTDLQQILGGASSSASTTQTNPTQGSTPTSTPASTPAAQTQASQSNSSQSGGSANL